MANYLMGGYLHRCILLRFTSANSSRSHDSPTSHCADTLLVTVNNTLEWREIKNEKVRDRRDVLLYGCATPTPLPEIEEIRLPDLETMTTAELGDTMVRYLIVAKMPSYQLLKTYRAFNNAFSISAGTILTPFGSDPVYESFREGGLCRHRETGEWCARQSAYGDCNALTCGVGKVEISAWPADWIDTMSRNIDQQLMYNGRVGSDVKFTYREFTSSGYARDSFFFLAISMSSLGTPH